MTNNMRTEELPGDEFQPAPEMVISNLDVLKVAADPTRLRIMEVLTDRPMTVKQMAHTLDTTPTKLYYHVNLLEEHDLITVTSSRIVSGIIEKTYRNSARSLRVDKSLLAVAGDHLDEGVSALLAVVFDATRDDVLNSIHRGLIKLEEENPVRRNSILSRTITRLTPDQYEEFFERLRALLMDFNNMDMGKGNTSTPDHAKGAPYGLTVALYPFAEPDPADDTNTEIGHWSVD